MEVPRQLGCGFLEPVYQEALAIELANYGIPFQTNPQITQIMQTIIRAFAQAGIWLLMPRLFLHLFLIRVI